MAVLEQLVHVDLEDLPADWNVVVGHPACQKIGVSWTKAASSPVLEVPSAVIPQESNYLINPAHPDAQQIRVVEESPFQFDERLPELRSEETQ